MELEITEKKLSNINIIDNDKTDDKLVDISGFEYTKDDIIEGEILKVETQLKKIQYLDEKYPVKEKDFKIELTKKVIMNSLFDIGLDIFTDTIHLNRLLRIRLQDKMREYEDKTIDEINNKFNMICNDLIFDNPKMDYSKIPIFNA